MGGTSGKGSGGTAIGMAGAEAWSGCGEPGPPPGGTDEPLPGGGAGAGGGGGGGATAVGWVPLPGASVSVAVVDVDGGCVVWLVFACLEWCLPSVFLDCFAGWGATAISLPAS